MLPAGQPSGTGLRPSGPWPGLQLACSCAHANTDTNEKPTMTQLPSKIERPLTRPLGDDAGARFSLLH